MSWIMGVCSKHSKILADHFWDHNKISSHRFNYIKNIKVENNFDTYNHRIYKCTECGLMYTCVFKNSKYYTVGYVINIAEFYWVNNSIKLFKKCGILRMEIACE